MSNAERQNRIIDILEREGYVTVKYLSNVLDYSFATINRDLNALQDKHLVSRSYGGVELVRAPYVSVLFRAHKMRAEKLQIAKCASNFVKDGDVIFIDGSTTAQCMERALTERKNLTVITNNLLLSAKLSEHKIKVVCLGGTVVEAPSMLYGKETVENALKYRVDKAFFSTGAVSKDGLIASGVYDLMLRAITSRAKEVFYLVDHEKVDKPFNEVYGDFSTVNYVISDYDFPLETKERFLNVQFIKTEKCE